MRPPRLCMRGAEQSTVLIAAPRDATARLLDQSSARCSSRPKGATAPGLPHLKARHREPECGSDEKWTMMVSAPGYTMAAGTE